MFCSTVIPTIGRSTLKRAVVSVLEQDVYQQELEIIVVNDSGRELLEAAWLNSTGVQVINTNRRNRSVARNAGAAVARGKYLHFLDDDDWMLPGAFQSLSDLANQSRAAWLYGAYRLVDNSGKTITEIYPEETGNCFLQLIAWEWLPLQASLISSEAFFAVGGFTSLDTLLGGFEDVDLSRQVSYGYDFDRINRVVTCIRAGDQGSTTNYVDIFRQNRKSRERALEKQGSFVRLWDSAATSSARAGYWYGKIAHYFLASMKYQLRHKSLSSGLSRAFSVAACFVVAGHHWLSRDFWTGVFRRHYPRMELALRASHADHLYAETRAKLHKGKRQ